MLTKKLYILISAIVLGLSLIAGTITAIVVTQPKTDAYIGEESSAAGYIGNLLTPDGTGIVNKTKINLFNAIGQLGTVSGTLKASEMNDGQPIIFQMGEIEDKPIYWQVVYRTKDYITVWMCESYSYERYSSSTSYSQYSDAILNTYVDDIFSELSNNFIMMRLTSRNGIVATPNVMESDTGINWQTVGQNNTIYSGSSTSRDNNLSGTARHDGFWIPSFYEVCNTSTSSNFVNSQTDYTGLWGLNSTMRGFDGTVLTGSTSSTDYYWLRSGIPNNSSSTGYGYALRVNTEGEVSTRLVSYANGVRPAAHLSLTALNNSISYLLEFSYNKSSGNITSNADETTVTSNGTNFYYTLSSQAIFTATPNENYGFVSWVDNNTGQMITTDTTLTLTITSDMSITANFSAYITIHNGSSQIPNYKIANDEAQMTMKLMIYPDTGQFINSISFDNITFYPIDSWRAGIYGACPFALYTEYYVTKNSNYFGLTFDFVTYEKAINIYVTTTSTPYGDLEVPNDGASVSGVAVSSTKGGSVTMVGNNLDEMEDTDYITCVAKVCLQGYEFKGWYNANDMETCLSTSESTNFTKAQIEDSQIVAVFEPIENDSINEDINN